MGVTRVDLRFSRSLAPRAFDPTQLANIDMPAAGQAITVTRLGLLGGFLQYWRVARVVLSERLGRPFRCEVFLVRQESFPPDPATPPPDVQTWFERLADRIDDQDATTGDDLRSATDQLRNTGWNPGIPGIPGLGPSGGGFLPTALLGFANDALPILNQQLNDNPFDNWEQDLLGIPAPGQPWIEEIAPSPGELLGTFRSVLLRRFAGSDTTQPLHGRWVSGLVTELEDYGTFADGRRLLRVVIEPQLSKLALRTGHRVFENQNAIQIAQEIFREAGIYEQGFDWGVTQYVTRPFCVQYGETDLDFVLRLFSEEGLVPIFDQHFGAERLRLLTPLELASGQGALGTGPGGEPETLDASDLPSSDLVHGFVQDRANREVLWDYEMRRVVRPVEVSVRTTNFSLGESGELPAQVREQNATQTPRNDLDLDATLAPPGLLSLHEFPGRTLFRLQDDGSQEDLLASTEQYRSPEAELELFAARADAARGRGRTNAVALTAGHHVMIADGQGLDPMFFDDAARPFGRKFLVTSQVLLAEDSTALGPQGGLWALPARPREMSAVDPIDLEAVIETVPSGVAFLPPRIRAPRAGGVQTAITKASVTPWQKGAGRIGVDCIGRVRARLHWDRRAPSPSGEQGLSPPIRVATPWAGHAWGTTFLPREDMELVLAFQYGDPLQPIALGAVHGFVNPAPRERPHLDVAGQENNLANAKIRDERQLHYKEEKVHRPTGEHEINMIRTQVHQAPGDRPFGYHELSFDDTPGKERVRLHSEGVLEEEAEHDHRTLVGRDQMNVVQGGQTETIAGNQELEVGGTRDVTVLGNENEVVKGQQTILVLGRKHTEIGGDQSRIVGGDENDTIGKDAGAGIERTLEVAHDRKTEVGGDDVHKVGGFEDGKVGGLFQLGGSPLTMTQTSGPAAAAGAGAPGMSSADGETTLDGAAGKAELHAKGNVLIKAPVVNLWGSTAVRLECGEVWMEILPEELKMDAPGGIDLYIHGEPFIGQPDRGTFTRVSIGAMAGATDDEIRLVGEVGGTDLPYGKFLAILRSGQRTADPMDAIEGAPGVCFEDADVVQLEGAMAALKSRRVEIQQGEGPMAVFRDPTAEEKKLANDIPAQREKVIELREEMKKRQKERDDARERYREAAAERDDVERRIEGDAGADDELKDAVKELQAAERERDKAKKAAGEAERKLYAAQFAGEDTSDEQEEVDDAKEDLEDAEQDVRDAEEELADQREENAKLVDEYEDARREEEGATEALERAQDRLVAAQQRLQREEQKLRQMQERAEALDVPVDEPPPEPPPGGSQDDVPVGAP